MAPTADDQSVTVSFNTARTITLTATDADDGPQALTYSTLSHPQHGTLAGTPPNVIYAPDTGYVGKDGFTFEANDGAADSNTATVTITVLPPVATPGPGNTGTPFPYMIYRGMFHVTWQRSLMGITESSEASGTVEFANPIDINELWTQYGSGLAFAADPANSPAIVTNWRRLGPEGATATQVAGGTAKVSYGYLYILNSGQVAMHLNVNGNLTERDCSPGPPVACNTWDSAAAVAFFGLGECPLIFVEGGPDLGHLDGTASEVCTVGTNITQTASITWSLNGS